MTLGVLNSRFFSKSINSNTQNRTHNRPKANCSLPMAKMEKYNPKFNVLLPNEEAEEVEEDIQNGAVFSELKEHCILLLDLIQNPKRNHSFLNQLLHLLRRSPPQSLQPFFEYVLFPLLLLYDASVNCRSSKKFDSTDRSQEFSAVETVHKISDSVAECVLLCLEEVLKKCRLGSVDQMVVILKKLTYGALLSPLEASEEFRESVIRCFRALLLNLCPCSNESCPCQRYGDCPILPAENELQCPVTKVSKYDSVAEECLLEFLQSEPASAAVGHWLSLLLKAADIEATRGQRGSSKLRVEALVTLRVLVAKVGSADALAFYLPGVVSQIGKVLHVSRTMISGAAGSTEALDQAIRGFAEFLGIVLQDGDAQSIVGGPHNDISGFSSMKEKPLASFLDELRRLPIKARDEVANDSTESVDRGITMTARGSTRTNPDIKGGSLRVERNAEWFASTTVHVNKLLLATFPHLCVHPARKVRLGLLTALQVLLSKCIYTLQESRLMLLECLCVLVCDDSEEVSTNAQASFGLLHSSRGKNQMEQDIAVVFSRLVEKLPQVVLGNEESLAISHARKLLAVTYFCGPRLIAEYLLNSPVAAARFLDVFALCLSQNSVFAGSLKKLESKPSSGFMRSISEITAVINADHEQAEYLGFQNRKSLVPSEHLQNEYELPSMPPWFVSLGSPKLYQALAGILRLVSLYLFADFGSEGSLSVLIDTLLGHLRKLITELRTKEYHEESWQSWYKRTGSGHLVRQACTAACILNEMMFGLSDQAIATFYKMFHFRRQQESKGFCENGNSISNGFEDLVPERYVQKIYQNIGARNLLIDCIGSILHEYLAPEIWDLPLGLSTSILQSEEDGDISLHFFSDNAMLHQVIIEGIGIFNICLGKEFSSCGFLHTSLYMLLENVICSNFQVRRASDVVLHAISATNDHPTVGHLVLANSDYVIDSVCRQLRHLDFNPHVPSVLSAMLSYVGVADKILPLLEEPMRAVSLELEILGRHQHPNLTVAFLKAVAEIAKASRREACKLPSQAELYKNNINSKMLSLEKEVGNNLEHSRIYAEEITDTESSDSGKDRGISYEADTQENEWESVMFELNDCKRYRRIVGSIAGSCLVAVTPLIASADSEACLSALGVVEDGIVALEKVEEAYKHESETKEAIQQVIESLSFHNLLDTLDAAEDQTGENRLLPAMNKIWPFLVTCFRNKNLVAIRRCSEAISKVVQICGGDFFSRRFHTDGNHFWKLLSTSPYHKKPFKKEERIPLRLPYRTGSTSSEDPVAETSNLKVQVALLKMISELARNKRSASALEAVFKKVSGIVVGIACSGVKGLQDAAVNALEGLASIDPDLIWILLADVYYSRKKDQPFPPSAEFPEISKILPPPCSSKEYLYVLYGGQSYGFDVDFTSVEAVFKKLHALVFTSHAYI